MATKKVTITLPEEQLGQIQQLVEDGQADSVSRFIQLAVLDLLDPDAAWTASLDDALERTGGPLTEKEAAWADRVLTQGSRASHTAADERPDAVA
jgi:Arc/MetJ-type ribon-helix-helix transcriptional regulator